MTYCATLRVGLKQGVSYRIQLYPSRIVNALLEVPQRRLLASYTFTTSPKRNKYASISKIDLAALRASFRGSEKAFERVTLVTTKWGLLGASEALDAVARENRLKTAFWGDLIKSGSQMKRFENSPRSAWEIVDALLKHAGKDIGLNIQSVIVKIRTNLDANKKNGGGKDALFVLLYSIFGSFSLGIGDKRC
ncbi:hypothetical protein CPB84DRAFT_1789309 [Gymnopilus junonius]|uniref:Uncharacterized protein n=1 Tax=Gymnopilus junonius TaxID=109634 RepID=A0A9P5NFV8_GYMJU|nr:hypothetical protein CPB84DRAFT_1789309 [Gymnopilus junonius]